MLDDAKPLNEFKLLYTCETQLRCFTFQIATDGDNGKQVYSHTHTHKRRDGKHARSIAKVNDEDKFKIDKEKQELKKTQ